MAYFDCRYNMIVEAHHHQNLCSEMYLPKQDNQMKNNDTITIQAETNGFTVSRRNNGGYLVFSTMKELQSFLTGHFTYRASVVKTDSKSVALEE